MSFTAPASLAEQVARHLSESIIQGEIKDGERIQEQKVVATLEVSRGVVREAFLLLERQHLIEIIPRRGVVVTEMSASHIREVAEAMVLIVDLLVTKTIQHHKQEDIAFFEELLMKLKEYTDAHEVLAFHELSFEFARYAYRFLENELIEEWFDQLQPALRRVYYRALNVDADELEQTYHFFRRLLESVMERDVEAAREAVQAFAIHQSELLMK